MLEKFRRGASKIMVLLLFCVLILSFALWGIPNYNKDYSQNTLVQVGDLKVTEDDYRRFYDNRLNEFSAQAGRRLTRENARMMFRFQQMQQGNFSGDLDREVLNMQVNQAVLDVQAKKMGLGLSDASIYEAVRTDPQYQGPDKQFNRALFDDRIRQAGFSEQGYLRERKANEIREHITDAISGLTPSKTLVDIAYKYREEERTVTTLTLDPAKQPKVTDPDEVKLKAYYEENKRQFMAPETRKFSLLTLTRDDIKARAKTEDAEVKAAWDKAPKAWNIPERRRYQQIVFKTKDAAEAIAKEIAGGKSFLMASLEESAGTRLDQGPLPRSGIGDAKIAKAVFEGQVNEVSTPVEARGGVVLLRVTEIQPGQERPFEEVAKEIRDDIEQRKMRELTTSLHDQVEDLRGASSKLADIATKLKLKLREVADVNKSGNGTDGKPALDLTDAQKVIASVFEGPKEQPREMVELAEGGQAWVEVQAVTPERQKPFEEVTAEAKAGWLAAETRKAFAAAAEVLVSRIKAGETIDAVAKSQGLKAEVQKPFKRTGPFTGIPTTAARQAFTLPKGGVGSADTQDGKSRVVYVVSDIKQAAAPSKEEGDKLMELLQSQLQNDARTVYVSALRNRAGVTIDEAAFKRLNGAEQQQR